MWRVQVKLCLNTLDSKLYAIKIIDRKRLIDRRLTSENQDHDVLQVRCSETLQRQISCDAIFSRKLVFLNTIEEFLLDDVIACRDPVVKLQY